MRPRLPLRAVGTLLVAGFGVLASCGPQRSGSPDATVGGVHLLPLPFPSASSSARWMARTETTLRQWADFVGQTGYAWPGSDLMTRDATGAWRIRPGHHDRPATHVSRADAEAYCAWLSRNAVGTFRLPTDTEWEAAARGGLEGTRFPWGWEPAPGRAVFAADEAKPVGTGQANRIGLTDMAGNVWEWVAPADGRGEARGGAWSERDERRLECGHRQPFPPDYRDADVGFRVLREEPGVRAGYSAMPIQKVALK